MKVALAAARRAQGRTAENPAVGCALVAASGQLCAIGVTARGGRPHAETSALATVPSGAMKGGTAYVTLEPCAHTGVTGPCAAALIEAGLKRVVVAVQDPDPRVNGRGVAMLNAAGIETEIGVCAAEAEAILAGFFNRVTQNRPMVTVKTATSLDGMIALADGQKRWLTGPLMRKYVHEMRSRADAILTGVGTVLADDPALTCRLYGVEEDSPRRFVMDSALRTPVSSAIIADDGPVTLFCGGDADSGRAAALEAKGADIQRLPYDDAGHVDINAVLRHMADSGVNDVMVEAGHGLVTALAKAGAIDRLVWTQSHHIVGHDGIPAIGALNAVELGEHMHYMHDEMIGPDRLIILQRSR